MNNYSNSGPSKDPTRTNEPNVSVMTQYALPLAYNQTVSNDHLRPSAPTPMDQKKFTDLTPKSVYQTKITQPTETNSIPIKYYLMITWSAVNIFIGSILFGAIALGISIMALHERRLGDSLRARRAFINALVVNIIVTIVGIIILIIIIVYITRS